MKESSGTHIISDCPTCGKDRKLYFNVDTGFWDCKAGACGVSGGLFKLADLLGVRVRERSVVRSSTSVMMSGLQKGATTKLRRRERSAPGVSIEKINHAADRLFDEDDEDGKLVRSYLHGRGIDDEAIKHFRLGVMYIAKEPAVGIPYIDGDRVLMVKMRNVNPECEKSRRFMRTKGGDSALLNVDGIRGRTRVVLVEGELDAVSLWQSGITEVASTSLGAKKDIPQEWKELLAHVDDIVLWYDDDEAGDDAIEGLSTALGSHRVRIATIPEDLSDEVEAKTGKRPKDANDLVKAGVERERIQAVVRSAVGIESTNIVKPSALADEVRNAIDLGDVSLGESTDMIGLDALLRGWRPGELTIITGQTGAGKSTWTGYALELQARRGNPVLLSSLEDGPPALFRKLFQRRFGRPISSIKTDDDRQKAYEALDDMDRWPIYILNHFGRTSFERVYDDVQFAVSRLGTRHVMIDHLGYFSKDDRADKVEHLDGILMGLREMAEKLHIAIALIAHPRGDVDEMTVPDGGSIKGTSAAKQNCHNGITVFRHKDALGSAANGKSKIKTTDGRRLEIELNDSGVLIYVWKARHDEAREGHTIMSFDPRNLVYRDTVSLPAGDGDHDEGEEDEDPFMSFGFDLPQ